MERNTSNSGRADSYSQPLAYDHGRRKTGRVASALYFIGGAETELLEQCPGSDRQYIILTAMTLILVWCFHVCLITYSLTQAFGDGIAGVGGSLIGALIAASLIVGFDMLVIRGVLHERGRADLERSGLNLGRMLGSDSAASDNSGRPNTEEILSDVVQKWGPLVFRLGLSFGTASLIAIFFMLYFFRADIDAKIETEYNLKNAPVLARAAVTISEEIAEAKHEISADEAVVQSALKRKDQLGAALTGPAVDTPQGQAVQSLVEQVSELRAKEVRAEDDLRDATIAMNDELRGIKEHGASGSAGPLDRYKGRLANFRLATQELTARRAELKSAETNLGSMQAQISAQTHAGLQALADQHAQPDQYMDAAQGRLTAERASLNALQARGASERSEAQRQAPISRGPFARVNALYDLLEESRGAAAVDFWVGVFIMSLELSAIIATLSNRVSLTYTRLLAEREIMGLQASIFRVLEADARHYAELKRLRGPDAGPDIPHPSDPQPSPPGPGSGSPNSGPGGAAASTGKQTSSSGIEVPRPLIGPRDSELPPGADQRGQTNGVAAHSTIDRSTKPGGSLHHATESEEATPTRNQTDIGRGMPTSSPHGAYQPLSPAPGSPEPQNGAKTELSNSNNAGSPSPQGIPFLIPGWARPALRKLGYNDGDIRQMTPTEAFEILNSRGLWRRPD